jgi:hypothetical protein
MRAVLKFYPLSIIRGINIRFSQTLCIVTTKSGHTAWILRPYNKMSEQHFITIMSSIILVPNVSGVQLLPGKTRLTIKLSELEIA